MTMSYEQTNPEQHAELIKAGYSHRVGKRGERYRAAGATRWMLPGKAYEQLRERQTVQQVAK